MYMPYISIHVISLHKQVIYLCLKYINIKSYVDDNMTTSNKSLNSNHPRPLLLHSTAPSRLSRSIALWPWWPWPRRAPCHGLRRLASRFFLAGRCHPNYDYYRSLPGFQPPPQQQKKKWVFLGGKFMRFKTTRASRNSSKVGDLEADVEEFLRPRPRPETLDASRGIFWEKALRILKATGNWWLVWSLSFCHWFFFGCACKSCRVFLGTLHWQETQQLSKKWQRTSFNKNH